MNNAFQTLKNVLNAVLDIHFKNGLDNVDRVLSQIVRNSMISGVSNMHVHYARLDTCLQLIKESVWMQIVLQWLIVRLVLIHPYALLVELATDWPQTLVLWIHVMLQTASSAIRLQLAWNVQVLSFWSTVDVSQPSVAYLSVLLVRNNLDFAIDAWVGIVGTFGKVNVKDQSCRIVSQKGQ